MSALSASQIRPDLRRDPNAPARVSLHGSSSDQQGQKSLNVGSKERKIATFGGSALVFGGTVAVFCGSGCIACIAASVLQQNGFATVHDLPGSVSAWKKAGFELVTSSDAKPMTRETNKLKTDY
ncbi:hypothetical protein FF011L_04860 [Roseimaritima multifibrata]|uniref:Rhodanese domain-containing protein n=1 Tax=Roseimaritima multifibrata TaxID=1930274 RepID=A0A517MA79_9BACT|nr:hypothetical protein [Roseimaritima multifibrata]QDS91751.1 hypothetical protein FF011L_04860 [Roseimaritima multifibrata]